VDSVLSVLERWSSAKNRREGLLKRIWVVALVAAIVGMLERMSRTLKLNCLEKQKAESRRSYSNVAQRRNEPSHTSAVRNSSVKDDDPAVVSAGPKLTDQACPAFRVNTAECSKCKKQILLCDLQNHEDKCSDGILPNVFMTCNDCGSEIKWENIAKHEVKCPKRKDSDHGQWQEVKGRGRKKGHGSHPGSLNSKQRPPTPPMMNKQDSKQQGQIPTGQQKMKTHQQQEKPRLLSDSLYRRQEEPASVQQIQNHGEGQNARSYAGNRPRLSEEEFVHEADRVLERLTGQEVSKFLHTAEGKGAVLQVGNYDEISTGGVSHQSFSSQNNPLTDSQVDGLAEWNIGQFQNMSVQERSAFQEQIKLRSRIRLQAEMEMQQGSKYRSPELSATDMRVWTKTADGAASEARWDTQGFGRGSPSLYPNLPQQDFPPEFGRGKVVFRENHLTNRRSSQPVEPMDTGDEEKYEDAVDSMEAFAGASAPLESDEDLKECYFCFLRFPKMLIAEHINLCEKKPTAIPDPQEQNTSSMATLSKDTRGGGSGRGRGRGNQGQQGKRGGKKKRK
ncbi:unnamed protein product, partial [Cyprideis torosa]